MSRQLVGSAKPEESGKTVPEKVIFGCFEGLARAWRKVGEPSKQRNEETGKDMGA